MQGMGQPPGAVGDVGVREATIAEHDALAIGEAGGDRLVDGGEMVLRRLRSGAVHEALPSRIGRCFSALFRFDRVRTGSPTNSTDG